MRRVLCPSRSINLKKKHVHNIEIDKGVKQSDKKGGVLMRQA